MALSHWQAALLGLIQGLAEFLPVSSSGHLLLARRLLGLPDLEQMKAFDVLLHLATLLALAAWFRADLRRIWGAWGRSLSTISRPGGWQRLEPEARCGWLVLLGLGPTAVVALGLAPLLDPVFAARPWLVGLMLLGAGCQNRLAAEILARPGRGRPMAQLPIRGALWIGAGQGLAAVLRGISRSGTTILAGALCGLEREAALRFSFLLAAPAIAGAALVELPGLFRHGSETPPLGPMLLGGAVAAGVGYAALATVFAVVREGKLRYFAYYCWAIGLLALVVLRP
jgi:undecaprenyl-diphosphatase